MSDHFSEAEAMLGQPSLPESGPDLDGEGRVAALEPTPRQDPLAGAVELPPPPQVWEKLEAQLRDEGIITESA